MSSGSGCRDCGRPSFGHELCGGCTGKRLAERYVRDVVEELHPAVCYEEGGREGRLGSFAGEPGRALVIQMTGPRAGLWYDHKSGEGGDLIAYIGRCLGGGNAEGLRWARQWLGQPERERRPQRPVPAAAPKDEAETREYAARLWQQAVPLQRGDLAVRYLAARAIDLEALAQLNGGKLPATLRFHRRVWNRETRRFYPAMLAAIVGPDGFLGLHRTWLFEGADGRVDKAPLDDPKKSLGHYRFAEGAGCIRLWRPKWSEATEEDWLGLSEGIEDGLIAVLLHPSWRVAAGVSLSALKTTWVPPVFTRIVLIEQNDRPDSRAALLLPQVRESFRREDREVHRLRVPREVKDLNELAMRFRGSR